MIFFGFLFFCFNDFLIKGILFWDVNAVLSSGFKVLGSWKLKFLYKSLLKIYTLKVNDGYSN